MFPRAEIVELHNEAKLDAPSGTAKATAARMGTDPAIHSVRLPGPRRAPGGRLRRPGGDPHDPARHDLPRGVRAGRAARARAGARPSAGPHGRPRRAAMSVTFVVGDLTAQEVDAIVNAANEALAPGAASAARSGARAVTRSSRSARARRLRDRRREGDRSGAASRAVRDSRRRAGLERGRRRARRSSCLGLPPLARGRGGARLPHGRVSDALHRDLRLSGRAGRARRGRRRARARGPLRRGPLRLPGRRELRATFENEA